MLGPFTTASRLTSIHQVSPSVLSRAACASMSTTPTTTTTTTTRDRGDRYGPMEWAQSIQPVTNKTDSEALWRRLDASYRFRSTCKQPNSTSSERDPIRLPPWNSGAHDSTTQIGFHMQVYETLPYPVMCPFPPISIHQPHYRQTDRETDERSHAFSISATRNAI